MFHILVVDDDRSTRLFMRALLEAENYTVSLAEDGQAALEAMERMHVDLVVLDIMMPRMDGYEFARTLRAADNDLIATEEVLVKSVHGLAQFHENVIRDIHDI